MSSNVNISQFKFFRNDSPSGLPKHGVGLYIRDNIVVGKIFTDHQNTLALHLPEFNVYVLNIYRPPSYSSLENALFFSFIDDFCNDKCVIMLGDFNLPGINWFSTSVPRSVSFLESEFLTMVSTLGLVQWVKFPTIFPSGNILDLVFTSDYDGVVFVDSLEPLPGCCHVCVLFEVSLKSHYESQLKSDLVRDWHRGDFGGMNLHLSSVDWDFEYQ